VEWFEGGKHVVTGDRLSSTELAKKLSEVSFLHKEVGRFAQRPELADVARRAPDALAVSVAGFILEGLHVENRLNKTQKEGAVVFKR
jgi:magnesium chelatase subunit I